MRAVNCRGTPNGVSTSTKGWCALRTEISPGECNSFLLAINLEYRDHGQAYKDVNFKPRTGPELLAVGV